MDIYTHGHHESVVDHHATRTVENSARFLVPYLGSGTNVLDVGCGPGSITVDIAQRVNPGRVLGLDESVAIIDQARQHADRLGVSNVEFDRASAYDLKVPEASFDIVYSHQVLQHLTDPVRALLEMRRAASQGGIVAARDADYGGMTWAPSHPMLSRWLQLYHDVTDRNGAQADAGRYLLGWMQGAGFDSVDVTTSTWTYADPVSRERWGSGWVRRALESSFASQAIDYGLSDRAELESISAAWRWWSEQDDGFFAIVHTEAIGHN